MHNPLIPISLCALLLFCAVFIYRRNSAKRRLEGAALKKKQEAEAFEQLKALLPKQLQQFPLAFAKASKLCSSLATSSKIDSYLSSAQEKFADASHRYSIASYTACESQLSHARTELMRATDLAQELANVSAAKKLLADALAGNPAVDSASGQ